MLEHVESEDGVKVARNRSVQHIVDQDVEFPACHHPLLDILDEQRIEIDRGKFADFGLDDTGTKRVAASNFKHVLAAGQHLGDKLVARQSKDQMFRVLMPALIRPQPEPLETALKRVLNADLILHFLRPWFVFRLHRSHGATPF